MSRVSPFSREMVNNGSGNFILTLWIVITQSIEKMAVQMISQIFQNDRFPNYRGIPKEILGRSQITQKAKAFLRGSIQILKSTWETSQRAPNTLSWKF